MQAIRQSLQLGAASAAWWTSARTNAGKRSRAIPGAAIPSPSGLRRGAFRAKDGGRRDVWHLGVPEAILRRTDRVEGPEEEWEVDSPARRREKAGRSHGGSTMCLPIPAVKNEDEFGQRPDIGFGQGQCNG